MKIETRFTIENAGPYSVYSNGWAMIEDVSFKAAVEYAKCLPAICGESALNKPCLITGNYRTFAAIPTLAGGSFQVYLKRV